MRIPFIFVVNVLLDLCLATTLSAETAKISGSRYETGTVTHISDIKRFENLSFTSSSYLSGKLLIISSNASKPTVDYKKVFKADSKAQADEFEDNITVDFEELENELGISLETKSSPPWSGSDYSARVEITIQVPKNEKLKIYVRTSVFNVDITGPFASVDISNSISDISVTGITEKVRISSENCPVNVKDCTGPITINASFRPITLTNIDGKLGTIKLRNENGRITLESVKGEIDARTENAPITANSVVFTSGNSMLADQNATIKVQADQINGDLSIRNENGKVDLIIPDNSSAIYSLQADEGGKIYTHAIPIRVDLASRTLLTGTSSSGHNKIEIDMAGVGTINLEGKPAEKASVR